MTRKRTVYFLSDRTGITAETLGKSLLTQFDMFDFKQRTLPFIDTSEKAHATVEKINQVAQDSGQRPIIFSTTVSDEIRGILRTSDALFLDFFDTFIGPIETELDTRSSHTSGRAHGVSNMDVYESRIAAMNFALKHDDGLGVRNYDQADVILIAPSRCGKTPTCLYLAMQYGIFAANCPLTEDDMERGKMPGFLLEYREKLFGLVIDAERLAQVRGERRPGSRYASLAQCAYELRQARQLYRQYTVPYTETTSFSIEEIATMVLQEKGLSRRLA